MTKSLPILGVVAAVVAGASALYANSQIGRLNVLRAEISQSAGTIDGAVSSLGGQTAAVDDRVQALRAVAATPEMPVTGAQLQAQIDRLLALQSQTAAMASDDPAGRALVAAADLHAEALASLDALRNNPNRESLGRGLEVSSVIDQIRYEISLRAAVAATEGIDLALAFDPWAQTLDPAHYTSTGYDAGAVADNITYSLLSSAEKAALRTALVAAGEDSVALQAALDRAAAALGVNPAD